MHLASIVLVLFLSILVCLNASPTDERERRPIVDMIGSDLRTTELSERMSILGSEMLKRIAEFETNYVQRIASIEAKLEIYTQEKDKNDAFDTIAELMNVVLAIQKQIGNLETKVGLENTRNRETLENLKQETNQLNLSVNKHNEQIENVTRNMQTKTEENDFHIRQLDQINDTLWTEIHQLSHVQNMNTNHTNILTSRIEGLNEQQKFGGAVYVHWGKTSCPNRTDIQTIYTGVVGGSWYATKGGSSKYYCLPKDPELSSTTPTGFRNYMYGTELRNNFLKAGSYDEDASCSVCLSTKSSNVLMIPARTSCYPGWKTEYSGNLVGNDDSFEAAYEYVCLDSDPDFLQGGQGNTAAGAWMCPILTNCGALPCPPYTGFKAITCVVCLK